MALLASAGVAACGGGGDPPSGSTGTGGSTSATTASGGSGPSGSTSASASTGAGGAGGSAPEDPPPRARFPLSTSNVTSQTPTFRWELDGQWDGARVEICTTRTCSVAKTLDSVGTSAKLSKPLTPGLWYYRVFGRKGSTIAAHHGPVWQFTVGARSAPASTSYGTRLDLDGDGFADTVVGAPGGAGAAYVYAGSAAGLATTPGLTLGATDLQGTSFGAAIASAGDLDGDGYGELVVGQPGFPAAGGEGRAFVYPGSPTGLVVGSALQITAPPGMGGSFGATLTSAGDVNGDGYADVLVGAPAAAMGAGRAFLFLGGKSGLATTPIATLKGADTPGESFAIAVASAGDINGDGFGDVVVGAYNPAMAGAPAGTVRLYLGSAQGLVEAPASVLTAPGSAAGDGFGLGLGTPGDINGDGYTDLAIGAPFSAMGAGSVQVFLGGKTGVSALPAFTLQGTPGESGSFGRALAASGDVNHDGYSDILVGEPDAFAKFGRLHVFSGSNSGLNSVADGLVEAPVKSAGAFGATVSSPVDLDHDGYDDAVVGAPSVASSDGAAYAFRGSANGPIPVGKPALKAPAAGGSFGAGVAR
ncbi:MAG: FG-GAP-like repeat-containing protein [Byssovorax sp.]